MTLFGEAEKVIAHIFNEMPLSDATIVRRTKNVELFIEMEKRE